jgi:hypothetical protein
MKQNTAMGGGGLWKQYEPLSFINIVIFFNENNL